MSALASPEHDGRPSRRGTRIEQPGAYSYVLVDRDCNHVLGQDGTMLSLRECADNPAEVVRFDSGRRALAEIGEQSISMFRDLRALRKRVT